MTLKRRFTAIQDLKMPFGYFDLQIVDLLFLEWHNFISKESRWFCHREGHARTCFTVKIILSCEGLAALPSNLARYLFTYNNPA